MIAAVPKIVGSGDGVSTGLALQPEVRWSITDKARVDLTYTGAYTACIAAVLGAEPTIIRGSTADIDGVLNMTLESITINKRGGGRGDVKVTYSKALAQLAEGDDGYSEEDPQYQVEWVELSKSIEQHPRYTEAKDLAGTAIEGVLAIDDAGFAFIREYFAADGERQKEMYDIAADTGEINDFGSTAEIKELIGKKLRGQDSFTLYAPVIRAVSIINGISASSACGLIVIPPEAANAPDGYAWLQTADRTLPDGPGGRYTRTVEYTGADSIDADIYPTEIVEGGA